MAALNRSTTQAKPQAAPQPPSYVPSPPKIKRYVPPVNRDEDFSFSMKANKWVSEEAKKVYDPISVKSSTGTFAWLPVPMFDSQNPAVFGSTRYAADDNVFDEWSYCIPFVKRAGSDFTRAIDFCPYDRNPAGSEEFISSPYVTIVNCIYGMNKERAFGQHSEWYYLVKNTQNPYKGDYLPKVKQCYLMLGIMLYSVSQTYDKNATPKVRQQQEIHYNPHTLGKGVALGEKLALLAVSSQIWQDLAKTLNTRLPTGGWLYPDPLDPNQLAVFYAWPHRKTNSPVPGVVVTTNMDGMSGTVSGQLFDQSGKVVGEHFRLPPQFLTPQGMPSQEYYSKVPLHIGETINYMDDLTMIKELAHAFPDARDMFKIAFEGTDYAGYLHEPEIAKIFATTQQKFIYDSTIFEGAPVSQPVTTPYHHHQQQQAAPPPAPAHQPHAAPQQQPYQPPYVGTPYQQHTVGSPPSQPTGTYPTNPTVSNPSHYAAPRPQYVPPAQPAPQPQYSGPFPNTDQAKAAASDMAAIEPYMPEMWEDAQGYAVDADGNYILDRNGQPQLCSVLAAQYEAAAYAA